MLEELRERSRVGGKVVYLGHQAGEQEEERESPSSLAEVVGVHPLHLLEAVMNSMRNGLGMRETEIAKEPSRPWNPHFYAIFAQVHNTL
jgi:hypothetical protein